MTCSLASNPPCGSVILDLNTLVLLRIGLLTNSLMGRDWFNAGSRVSLSETMIGRGRRPLDRENWCQTPRQTFMSLL